MIPHLREKLRAAKEPLDEGESRELKSWLKNQCLKKLRSWHVVPSLHGNRWENNGNSERLFYCVPKPLCTVTAVIKLQDACSLQEKL